MQDDTTHTQAAAHGQLLLTLGWILLIRLPLTHMVQSDSTLGHVSIPACWAHIGNNSSERTDRLPFQQSCRSEGRASKGSVGLDGQEGRASVRLDIPRQEALVGLGQGAAANFRHSGGRPEGSHLPLSPLGVWRRERFLPKGAAGGTCRAPPPPSARLLLLSKALPTAPGGISPLTPIHRVSNLPSAFTVHVAGNLSLDTCSRSWRPTRRQRRGVQGRQLSSTAQSRNLSRVQGSCHKPGSVEDCSAA